MSRRKDADKIRRAKKKLKGLNLPCTLIMAFAGITRISRENVRNCVNLFMIFGVPMGP